MPFAAGQPATMRKGVRRLSHVRMSAYHNQHPAPQKLLAAAKVSIWLPPSPHSVLLVAVFLTFPLALVLLVGQRVSNPTTINSGKAARGGRGGLGMGQTQGATKQVMGGALMHFAAGQPATMRKGVRRLSHVRMSAYHNQHLAPAKAACCGKSQHMAAPLSPFRVVGGCVSHFSSRVGFVGWSQSVKSNHNQLRESCA